jgi:uncharacterized surface protein with fasciclin (FAS1) repeats
MKKLTPRTLVLAVAIISLGACSEAPTNENQADDLMVDDASSGAGQETSPVMVGGAEMFPEKNIVENATQSADHTTLVAAVKAAGLVETLAGSGPFTVFAPTNAAFEKLPAGTVDTLVKPESKKLLTGVLTYHVVAGRMTAQDLSAAIKQGGGTAVLKTVAGGELMASLSGGGITIKDATGGTSKVTQGDVMQSNGVIHVIDTVLMPG